VNEESKAESVQPGAVTSAAVAEVDIRDDERVVDVHGVIGRVVDVVGRCRICQRDRVAEAKPLCIKRLIDKYNAVSDRPREAGTSG
jgi:hypothetical protein